MSFLDYNEKPIKIPKRVTGVQYGELFPIDSGDTYLYVDRFNGDVHIVKTNDPSGAGGFTDFTLEQISNNLSKFKHITINAEGSYDIDMSNRNFVMVTVYPDGDLINIDLPLSTGLDGRNIVVKRAAPNSVGGANLVNIRAYSSPQEYIDNYNESPQIKENIYLNASNEYVWLVCDENKSPNPGWHVVSTNSKALKTFNGVDLSSTDYTIKEPGIYEIAVASSYSIIMPDPKIFDGEEIVVVNTDSSDANIDGSNTYQPYEKGSSTQLTVFRSERMFILKAINGKWRGGVLSSP